MLLAGKKVAVVGLGASGISAARLCAKLGASVVGMDEAPIDTLHTCGPLGSITGIDVRSTEFRSESFLGFDLVVVSPGVPDFESLRRATAAGVEVIGELELAFRSLATPIALVGGTNGKSTTSALVAAIFEAAGKRVFLGGNFGTPLSDAVGGAYDVHVVEISSFQAERVPTLRARAHALLNVTDDHLDRYASFGDYADAKGNPFVTMTGEDVAVVPHGDVLCEKQARRGHASRVTFGIDENLATVAPHGDRLVHRGSGLEVARSSFRLAGTHNLANACAAIGVVGAFDLGTLAEARVHIEHAFSSFEGLGHRCSLVAELDGVRYYDDSKGTNVGASVAALVGLVEPKAVLIAGGRDKHGAYEPLVDALRAKGRALVVIGEAAERIALAAKGALRVEHAASIDDAVRIARGLAAPGDAVLLSPACSSFDMFANYKERGDAFVAAVRSFRGNHA